MEFDTHQLKVWPMYFDDLSSGRRNFDVRVNDRKFTIGDRLVLHEYNPVSKKYSGRHCVRYVQFMVSIQQFLAIHYAGVLRDSNLVVLGLSQFPDDGNIYPLNSAWQSVHNPPRRTMKVFVTDGLKYWTTTYIHKLRFWEFFPKQYRRGTRILYWMNIPTLPIENKHEQDQT